MKVTIDTQLCSGHGNCLFAAPEVFDLDPATDIAYLRKTEFSEADESAVREAVADCPANAIQADDS
ncbi:ferredoxin [Sciscionella marina]|uniref:ferredoxin n=1 Tax=Sciscionella marina TaxID=508770 RepID=UPI000360A7E3|nr:ferredoxin [Sciscionella marina]